LFVSCDDTRVKKWYDKQGNLRGITHFDEQGKLHGYEYEYYPNGKISETVKWNHGQIIDTIYHYFENGQILRKTPYKDGLQHGTMLCYDSLGNFIGTSEAKYGFLHGKTEFFYPSGKLQYYSIQQKNKIVYEKRYDEQGRLVDHVLPLDIRWSVHKNPYDFYHFNVKLRNSIGDEIILCIGDVDTVKKVLLAKSDCISSKYFSIDYDFKIKQKGEHLFSGMFYELNEGDTIDKEFFYYKFIAH
jgi:hypothetical protein